jgi:flagellar hook-length control protein FliK
MHTPNLPIQVSGATSGPNAARAKNGAPESGGQFSQTLSREIEQRHAKAPVPAAAKAPAPAKAQQGAQADQVETQPQTQPQQQAGAEPAPPLQAGTALQRDAADGAALAAQAAQATATPVVDMLALVASFNQLAGTLPATQSAAATALMQAGLGLRPEQLPGSPAQPLSTQQLPAQPLPAGVAPIAAPVASAAGQAVQAAPDAAFHNMMAQADGSHLEAAAKAAVAAQPDPTTPGLPSILPESNGIAVPARATGIAQIAPDQPAKGLPETTQFTTLRVRESTDAASAPALSVSAPLAAAVQQTSLNLAQVAASGERIAARVGTPAWDNQVAQKIVWMAAGQEHSATLTLNPPDMGPMQVVLSVTNDLASVTFSSATPEVRQALADAMPKLRDMMSESGIALGNATVNDGSAQQQQAQGEPGRPGGAPARVELGSVSGSAAEAAARVAARPARAGELPGMVDTFA